MTMTIAIFNTEARKAVPVVRSLGAAGHRLISFGFERISVAAYSRYISKNIYLTGFDADRIERELSERNVEVIFPLEDPSIDFFGRNADRFRRYLIIMPPHEAFSIFADKGLTMKFARERGVTIPETHIPDSLEDAERFFRSAPAYPLVIKPRKSTGSIGLKVVRNPEEGIKQYRAIAERFTLPLIQEYVPPGGRTVGAEFLFYGGEEIMSFSHERIREYPVGSGPSTYCKDYRKDDAKTEARKLFAGLSYAGFAMVEFKEHPGSKKLYLMEVNPRPWGSITLPISVGLDFPLEALKIFADPKQYRMDPARSRYDTSVDHYMRWFLPGDLLSILFDRRMPALMKLRELFRRYENTAYQICSRRDPKPALMMAVKLMLNAFNIRYIRKYVLRKW